MRIDFTPTGELHVQTENTIESYAVKKFLESGKDALFSDEFSYVIGEASMSLISEDAPAPTENPKAEIAKNGQETKSEAYPNAHVEIEPAHTSEKAKRESIKAKLTAMGILFDNKAKTATLEKLLEKGEPQSLPVAQPLGVAPVVPAQPIPLDVAPVVPAQPIPLAPAPIAVTANNLNAEPSSGVLGSNELNAKTIEICRDFALNFSNEKARELVESFGVKKISELTDAQKMGLIDKIHSEKEKAKNNNVFA